MFGFFSRKKPAATASAAGAGGAAATSKRRGGVGGVSSSGRQSRPSRDNERFQHRDPDGAIKFYDALVGDTTFADAEVVAGGGAPIPFHSFVIASRSKIMTTMLASATRGPTGRMRLEFPTDSEACWRDMIRYCYSESWVAAPQRAMELRKAADRYGFEAFASLMEETIAALFAGNFEDGLAIGAQAWDHGDHGLALSAFAAAFRSPAQALASKCLMNMSEGALAAFLSDDRATSSELRCMRVALRWAITRLDKEEEAGRRVPRAAWWTDEMETAEQSAKASAAAAAAAFDEAVSASAAAAAAAALGPDEESESKEADVGEVEAESKEPEPEPDRSPLPVARSISRSRSRSSSTSSDSDSDSDAGLALGFMSTLFMHTSTGSVPEFEGHAPAADTSSASLAREWIRQGRDTRVWDEWDMSYDEMTPISKRLKPKYAGPEIRRAMGGLMGAVRWPLLPAWFIANEVAPMGILTTDELASLFSWRFLPPGFGNPATIESAGWSCTRRKPIETVLRIMLWGGGGASGKYDDSGYGGAGGYLCVKYSLRPGETLKFFVGEGGYADNSSSARTTQAWPNSGRGGYNWKSGSGGGATYFVSSRTDDEVVAGAGGGGGGSAGRSYSSGGGGGGGTRDGKVGSGGDCETASSGSMVAEVDGNGRGGRNDSGGSSTDGASPHGAGGRSGASSRADGGGGGEASHKHATVVHKTAASTYAPVVCPVTSKSAGEGGHSGDRGGNTVRGKAGMALIQIVDTGEIIEVRFNSVKTAAGEKKRPSKTPYEFKHTS